MSFPGGRLPWGVPDGRGEGGRDEGRAVDYQGCHLVLQFECV